MRTKNESIIQNKDDGSSSDNKEEFPDKNTEKPKSAVRPACGEAPGSG